MGYELLDEAESRDSHSYGYTIVAAILGCRVRAQVTRDGYQQQSFALPILIN